MELEATIYVRQDEPAPARDMPIYHRSLYFTFQIGVVLNVSFNETTEIWRVVYRIDDYDTFLFDLLGAFPASCILTPREMNNVPVIQIISIFSPHHGTSRINVPLVYKMPVAVSHILYAFDAYLEKFADSLLSNQDIAISFNTFFVLMKNTNLITAHPHRRLAVVFIEKTFVRFHDGISFILKHVPPLEHIERALLAKFECNIFKNTFFGAEQITQLITEFIDYRRADMIQALFAGGMPALEAQRALLVHALRLRAYDCVRALIVHADDSLSKYKTITIRVMPEIHCPNYGPFVSSRAKCRLACALFTSTITFSSSSSRVSVFRSMFEIANAFAVSVGGHIHNSYHYPAEAELVLARAISKTTPIDIIETLYERNIISKKIISIMAIELDVPALHELCRSITDDSDGNIDSNSDGSGDDS